MEAIKKINFKLQGQKGEVYHGKVRDVYSLEDDLLLMITSDRISAFDCILPKPIPYKGQVLNQLANHFLLSTTDILPNWVLDVPHPNVTIGKKCRAFKVEMVVRGYLCGHAWREYAEGKRSLCGVDLPDGMKQNDPFPEPIITPTTKADQGHDQDISRQEIIRKGIVEEIEYEKLEQYSLKLFKRGSEMAKERGLILADTKYEFGKLNDQIFLIDEIHTPDSSRYFYRDGFQERQKKGEKQQQLSKEFVREWLIEKGFQGKKGQEIPDMPPEFIQAVSGRYIKLYEQLIGKSFQASKQVLTESFLNSCIQNQLNKKLKF